MENLVDTLSHLRDAVVSAGRDAALHEASDDALLASMAAAGSLLRAVEAVLVEGVGELVERSGSFDRADRLTTRVGCRNVNELVQRLTRCAASTAARFERAQEAVRVQRGLVDEVLPAKLPAVRSALVDGVIGVDGILAVAQPLLEMRDRVPADRFALADETLAEIARGAGPDAAPPACAEELRVHAQVWATILDADGAEPVERRAARRRSVTLGAARDGMIPIRGELMPEVAAQLQRIFDSLISPRVRFDDPDGADAVIPDDRSRPQKQHDALATALTVAAASRDLPSIGGAAPTLVVSVRADDLIAGAGWAHAEGVDLPVPILTARHIACAGVVQRVALGVDGRIRRLGTEERVFNRHQRRAIALRDGGCVIPGCSVPAGWCEIHHVTDHAKGGPTHTDNGVLLCWHHHRFIDTGPWRIRMNRGVPEVQAPRWIDPEMRWRATTKSPIRQLDRISRRT